MALKRSQGSPGTLVVLEHESEILKDNPLGDPYVRKLAVWLPPQYDSGHRRFPATAFHPRAPRPMPTQLSPAGGVKKTPARGASA